MSRPIFYSFRRCPYAMRARLAIYLAQRPVELREILLRDKPEEMRAASAKATVPVLVLPNGTVIDESLEIMQWAWDTSIAPDRQAVISAFDGSFKFHLDRYKYASRYVEADRLYHRGQALAVLENTSLTANWLGGDAPDFSDYAVLPFIRQFRIADPHWFDHDMPLDGIRDWLLRFLDLPEFTASMKKYPAWRSGQLGIDFP